MLRCRTLALVTLALILVGVGAPVSPVSAGSDPCPEPNDQLPAACYLGPGSPAYGYLDTPADVDLYRLELGPDQAIAATLEAVAGAYGLRLHLADGSLRAEGAAAGTGDRAIRLDGLAPGTYYLSVVSVTGAADPRRPYTLSVDYPISLVLADPAPPDAPAGVELGGYDYIPAPASNYRLRSTDLPGIYQETSREDSEDGRVYRQVIVAQDVDYLEDIPVSTSGIGQIETQIYIYPYGSNDELTQEYDRVLEIWRTRYQLTVERAEGWGSEQVFSFSALVHDEPRMFDRRIALKHRNVAVFIEIVGLERYATWDALSRLLRAVESRVHAAAV